MGWGKGDETRVELAKIQLSVVKQQLYKLYGLLSEIEHDEKRDALLNSFALAKYDDIERTLNR